MDDKQSFIPMIKHLQSGDTLKELDKLIAEGVDAIDLYGGKSTITLKIQIEKPKKFNGVVAITETVTHKFPEAEKSASIMFSTIDGRLTTQRQDQKSMDFEPATTQPRPNITAIKDAK